MPVYDLEEFEFLFSYRGREFKAFCSKFRWFPRKHFFYRVTVNRGSKEVDVYTFYDIHGGRDKFFWFKWPDKREEIAKTIATTLEKLGR